MVRCRRCRSTHCLYLIWEQTGTQLGSLHPEQKNKPKTLNSRRWVTWELLLWTRCLTCGGCGSLSSLSLDLSLSLSCSFSIHFVGCYIQTITLCLMERQLGTQNVLFSKYSTTESLLSEQSAVLHPWKADNTVKVSRLCTWTRKEYYQMSKKCSIIHITRVNS